jgi:hypothetical protein
MDGVIRTANKTKMRLDNLRKFYAYMLYKGTPYEGKKIHLDVKYLHDNIKFAERYASKQGQKL